MHNQHQSIRRISLDRVATGPHHGFTMVALHHAPAPPVRRGLYWELAGGEAMGFVVPQRGELRVVRGRIWATTDGPHGRREGDHVLAAGDALLLSADRRLVVESWSGREPARVEWQALPQASGLSPFSSALSSFWQRLSRAASCAASRLTSRRSVGCPPPHAH